MALKPLLLCLLLLSPALTDPSPAADPPTLTPEDPNPTPQEPSAPTEPLKEGEEGDPLDESALDNLEDDEKMEKVLGKQYADEFSMLKHMGCFFQMERRVSQSKDFLDQFKNEKNGSEKYISTVVRVFDHCKKNVKPEDQMKMIMGKDDEGKIFMDELMNSDIKEIARVDEPLSEQEQKTYQTLVKMEKKLQEMRKSRKLKERDEGGFAKYADEDEEDEEPEEESSRGSNRKKKRPLAVTDYGFLTDKKLFLVLFFVFVGAVLFAWKKLFDSEGHHRHKRKGSKEKRRNEAEGAPAGDKKNQ